MNPTASTAKPNILLLMVDQMTVNAMSIYGNTVCQMPHLEQLARQSTVFDNAYCAAPLCAPSRFALLSGKEAHRIDAFDNGSEFHADVPTLAHYLRAQGYWTTLCGKMHFIGPDQLHGYHERLTTDVYPASFAWVPHWDKGASYITSGVTCASVIEAAPCIRSMQMDYDDEVEYQGLQKLYDLARRPEQSPFFLTVSFTHPHHPFTISQEYWDRYQHDEIDMPVVDDIPFEALDYHSRGLYFAHGRHLHTIEPHHTRNARHAYYGMLSYLDDKIGRVMSVLAETGLDENTLIVFTADHGEMLGERGMWHKHNFFEPAVRVPLLMRFPPQAAQSASARPERISHPVSHIDLAPTLLNYLGYDDHGHCFDGHNFMPLLADAATTTTVDPRHDHPVVADYLAIGPCVPCRMIRQGDYKYCYTHGHDEQLYQLTTDPHEQHNLADDPDHAEIKAALKRGLLANWDPEAVDQRVKQSQRQRIAINNTPGQAASWDYVYRKGDDQRFVRNRKVDGTKGKYRLPRIAETPPNRPVMTQDQINTAMKTGRLA